MSTAPTRLWLIRHGETDWNTLGRVQGHTPTSLNANGRRQAEEVARLLVKSNRTFAACYSSDLPRAAETAAPIAAALNLTIQTTPALRERSFGDWEGSTATEIQARRIKLGLPATTDLAEWNGVPGVESNETLWQRVSGFLQITAQKHAGQDVLVVTHGGVVMWAVYRTLGIPDGTPRRFPLTNGIVAVLEQRPAGFYLISYADLAFLQGQPEQRDTSRVNELPRP
jgi:2,3-bisphosphoglycerate-dependent phosphoglycerate mutase